MNKIGNKIKRIRISKEMTRAQMAAELDISERSYGKIENGETNLTMDRLEQIGKVLDKSPVEIMALDETLTMNSNHQQGGQANIVNLIYQFSEKERKLYDKLIEDKEKQIQKLQEKLKLYE